MRSDFLVEKGFMRLWKWVSWLLGSGNEKCVGRLCCHACTIHSTGKCLNFKVPILFNVNLQITTLYSTRF